MGPEQGTRERGGARRRLLIWGLGALAVAIVAGAGLTLAVWSSADGDGDTAAIPVPTPTAPPPSGSDDDAGGDDADGGDGDAGISEADAGELISSTVTAISEAPVTARPDDFLTGVAAGDYLREVEAQYTELEASGWTIEGAPVVESTSILSADLDADPATSVVAACIDSSAVRVLDTDGEPVGESTTPRALHHFTLIETEDGTWRISAHTFPADPAC